MIEHLELHLVRVLPRPQRERSPQVIPQERGATNGLAKRAVNFLLEGSSLWVQRVTLLQVPRVCGVSNNLGNEGCESQRECEGQVAIWLDQKCHCGVTRMSSRSIKWGKKNNLQVIILTKIKWEHNAKYGKTYVFLVVEDLPLTTSGGRSGEEAVVDLCWELDAGDVDLIELRDTVTNC